MKDATRVVRAGQPPVKQGECFLPGPTFASIYYCSGDPVTSPYSYGRFDNPTWTAFEAALQELEGGPAVSFASGMAAVAAVLGVTLRPGDLVLVPQDCYYTTRLVARDYLEALGVIVKICSGQKDLLAGLTGARLLWLETPSNPALAIYDIAELSQAARDLGVLVAVDNTTSTALLQQPLSLGADFSVASDSKALAGHGDIILGHVAARDPEWIEALSTWRTRMGSTPGPMETWLAHRSLASLDLRLERMCGNAERIARVLSLTPRVLSVVYPGLSEHPNFDLASRQMQRFGHIVSFELANAILAGRFLEECCLVDETTSFGSLHTTAEQRGRWGGDQVSPGFIRMSLGCEHGDDLEEDILRALEIATGNS